MENYFLITFISTHDAIGAEKILSEAIHITIRPTPRQITSTCGISIELKDLDLCIKNSLLSRIKMHKVYKFSEGKFMEIRL